MFGDKKRAEKKTAKLAKKKRPKAPNVISSTSSNGKRSTTVWGKKTR